MTTAIQKTLLNLGFILEPQMGGDCMAFAKDAGGGWQVLVTDCDGGVEMGFDSWYVGLWSKEGEEIQAHWRDMKDTHEPLRGEKTVLEALRACGVEVQL